MSRSAHSSGPAFGSIFHGEVTQANAFFLDDRDRAFFELIVHEGKGAQDGGEAFLDGVSDAAEEEHARVGASREREDGSEIGIGGDEHAVFGFGVGHHVVVGGALHAEQAHMGGVMAGVDQLLDEVVLQGLVYEEPHAG